MNLTAFSIAKKYNESYAQGLGTERGPRISKDEGATVETRHNTIAVTGGTKRQTTFIKLPGPFVLLLAGGYGGRAHF